MRLMVMSRTSRDGSPFVERNFPRQSYLARFPRAFFPSASRLIYAFADAFIASLYAGASRSTICSEDGPQPESKPEPKPKTVNNSPVAHAKDKRNTRVGMIENLAPKRPSCSTPVTTLLGEPRASKQIIGQILFFFRIVRYLDKAWKTWPFGK